MDFVELINNLPTGWVKDTGIKILTATADEVTCELEISDKHHQGYGIVHGGVHCGLIETLASIGAAIVAHPRGQRVVGLENATSFVRAARAGKITGSCKPITRGRHSQLWQAWIRDAEGKLLAEGKVRLLCIDENAPLG